MGLNNSSPWTAGGTIRPSRFIKADSSAPKTALEADANERIIGVSQLGTRDAPGTNGAGTDAASSGEEFQAFGLGDVCLIELGGTVTASAQVKSDAEGCAVAAATTGTTLQWVGGVALQGGVAGEKVLIQIMSYPYYPALA